MSFGYAIQGYCNLYDNLIVYSLSNKREGGWSLSFNGYIYSKGFFFSWKDEQ